MLPVDVERRLETLGATLEGRPEIRFAYVFGSAGRGKLRPLSDVDVAVYLDDAVDVVVLNRAPTALVGRILQSRRVVTERDPFLRHRFESNASRQFMDFRIFERRLLTTRFARG
jgi:predicted nucleotidyltransferase